MAAAVSAAHGRRWEPQPGGRLFHRLAPFHEVWHLAVDRECCFIPVYFIQMTRVRILGILEHVKPQASRLDIHRAADITEHRFLKSVTMVRNGAMTSTLGTSVKVRAFSAVLC